MLNKKYYNTEFITGLRAVAIFMVFGIHLMGAGFFVVPETYLHYISLGKYGVNIFFVISGFTIFYQFFNRKYHIRKFLIYRVIRVSIPYFPLILLVAILQIYVGQPSDYLNVIMHIFYINYIVEGYQNSLLGVEWTLSIEVFYYFFLGYLIYKSRYKLDIKKAILWCAFFMFLSVIVVISVQLDFLSNAQGHYLPLKYGYMFLLGGIGCFLRAKLELQVNEENLNKFSNLMMLIIILLIIIYVSCSFIPNSSTLNEVFFL